MRRTLARFQPRHPQNLTTEVTQVNGSAEAEVMQVNGEAEAEVSMVFFVGQPISETDFVTQTNLVREAKLYGDIVQTGNL